MNKYRVLVHGQNFHTRDLDEGVTRRLGFYTSVFVEAADPPAASDRAIDLVREDESLPRATPPAVEQRPIFVVEEIAEVQTFEGCHLPRTGFAFYDMDSEDEGS